MQLKYIIVEDEPLAIERLQTYAQKISYLEEVAIFENALDALLYLKSNEVDLIFLDIQMDELTGIQFMEQLKNPPAVIFCTAYPDYAIKGYELSVQDYLLKPYGFERFLQAVEKVYTLLEKGGAAALAPIFIKTENRLERIDPNALLYVEGMRDYRCLHFNDHRLMTLQTFGELTELFAAYPICRVHKSYMVGLHHIERIERKRIKIKEAWIPISATYEEHFLKQIKS
jgi:two-component system LytT family response regulator